MRLRFRVDGADGKWWPEGHLDVAGLWAWDRAVVDVDDVYEFVFRWIGRIDAPEPDLNADCEFDVRDLVLIIDAIGPKLAPNRA